MTKKDFVKNFADKVNASQKDANTLVDAFLDCVEEALTQGDRQISFVGRFGLKVVAREAREGRNPQTGKPIKIPAKKVVRFKAGSLLEERVNSK